MNCLDSAFNAGQEPRDSRLGLSLCCGGNGRILRCDQFVAEGSASRERIPNLNKEHSIPWEIGGILFVPARVKSSIENLLGR